MSSRNPKTLGACAAALLALLAAACGDPPMDSTTRPTALATGTWRGWLDAPGGELPFGLELLHEDGAWRAVLGNGEETEEERHVTLDGDELVIDFKHYGATITARASEQGRRLDGVWARYDGVNDDGTTKESRLDFHATAGESPRFPAFGQRAPPDPSLAGRWLVTWSQTDNPGVAILDVAADGTTTGTFQTTLGDYRWLAGRQEGGALRLSTFDGSHAFLFAAELQPDGTLAGDFWSRDSWHETWTAVRDEDATMPSAFELAVWKEGVSLSDLVFPDVDGTPRALDDPAFAGKAIVIHCFGTWCPNCNDASDEVVRMHEAYRDRGLSVIGLAFEKDAVAESNAERLRLYAERHGATYPMLVAGLDSKQKATESFGALDKIRAFPTTIFLHGDGRVRAVHTGFSGPATGQAFLDQRAEWEAIVEELLAAP
jgi:thiol-disulfide isomerase/thioredoxin